MHNSILDISVCYYRYEKFPTGFNHITNLTEHFWTPSMNGATVVPTPKVCTTCLSELYHWWHKYINMRRSWKAISWFKSYCCVTHTLPPNKQWNYKQYFPHKIMKACYNWRFCVALNRHIQTIKYCKTYASKLYEIWSFNDRIKFRLWSSGLWQHVLPQVFSMFLGNLLLQGVSKPSKLWFPFLLGTSLKYLCFI